MNRKAFLSTIAALISIPFIGKSKEKELPATSEEIAKYFKVPPAYLQNYKATTFRNPMLDIPDELSQVTIFQMKDGEWVEKWRV